MTTTCVVPSAARTASFRPVRIHPPSAGSAVMVTSSSDQARGWSARATAPATLPMATAERKRCCCSGVPTSRTIGANWVTVARRGPGATARPSSSTTTAVSRMVSPMPPYSSGTARAGQSRATMEPQSFSGASPVSTTARTTSMGHSFWRNERTESRSSSCSPVNSSSTALPPRPRRSASRTPPDASEGVDGSGRVYLTPMSGSEACTTFTAPRSLGRNAAGSALGGRRSLAQARAGDTGGSGRSGHGHRRPLAYTLRCASSSTAEQRTLNPQVSGSNPEGRTQQTPRGALDAREFFTVTGDLAPRRLRRAAGAFDLEAGLRERTPHRVVTPRQRWQCHIYLRGR